MIMKLLSLHACAVRTCVEIYLRTSGEVDYSRVRELQAASINASSSVGALSKTLRRRKLFLVAESMTQRMCYDLDPDVCVLVGCQRLRE